MADLPIHSHKTPANADQPEIKHIKVTQENFGPILVHYLQLVYGRLGYIIKLLEKQKEND